MSKQVNLVIDCPNPSHRAGDTVTQFFDDSFCERVIVRFLPILARLERYEIQFSCALSARALEALATIDWAQITESVECRINTADSCLAQRFAAAQDLLRRYDGSIVDYLKEQVSKKRLTLIARPSEGVDLACWFSHPGLIDFHVDVTRQIFHRYLGAYPTQIDVRNCGYAPQLDGVLSDAEFTVAYVDDSAFRTAQAKLDGGLFKPVLNPTSGMARCAVAQQWSLSLQTLADTALDQWLNTTQSAILRAKDSGLSVECYPSELGLARPYQQEIAQLNANTLAASFAKKIVARLASKTRKGADAVLTVWMPATTPLWWEEMFVVEGLIKALSDHEVAFVHMTDFLTESPVHQTAWLGAVLSTHSDEMSQLWLPRRVNQLYDLFRKRQREQDAIRVKPMLESVARLLFFGQVIDDTQGPHSADGASSLDLLDAAQELLMSSPSTATAFSTKPALERVCTWASETELVSVNRA